MKSKTVNGIGWQVELYTKQLGWKPLSPVFLEKESADVALERTHLETSRKNLRVYEVLEGFNDAL